MRPLLEEGIPCIPKFVINWLTLSQSRCVDPGMLLSACCGQRNNELRRRYISSPSLPATGPPVPPCHQPINHTDYGGGIHQRTDTAVISVVSHLATLSRNFDSCVKFAGVTWHVAELRNSFPE